MGRSTIFLGGIGVGAAIMYLLDRELGRGRRIRLVQGLGRAGDHLLNATRRFLRDVEHRGAGAVVDMLGRLQAPSIPDDRLVARVRAAAGHVVDHAQAHALRVSASQGRVTLDGTVAAEDARRLVHRIAAIPGVRSVGNRLILGAGGTGDGNGSNGHDHPGGRGHRVGAGSEPRFEIQKALTIAAPPEEVFNFWSRFENFPRFMAHVREVHLEVGTLRSRWVVQGPAGVPITWRTILTRFEPHTLLGWETLPDARVMHSGSVRFEPLPQGRTRIHVRIAYRPPGGALGHSLATLFHCDPRSALNEDLLRLKSLLESGKTTRRGQEVYREDIPDTAAKEAT